MPYALSAGTGILYDANNIILFGGDKGTVFHKTETLIAAINAEKDEVKKQELIKQKNKLQSNIRVLVMKFCFTILKPIYGKLLTLFLLKHLLPLLQLSGNPASLYHQVKLKLVSGRQIFYQ